MLPKKRAAKVGHKKTRTGCLRCRARRVKCDEQAPVCANCLRLGLECRYQGQPSTGTNHSSSHNDSPLNGSSHASSPHTVYIDGRAEDKLHVGDAVPEADQRYLQRMELRLLHAWITRPKRSGPVAALPGTTEWIQAWFNDLPRLAFDHDNLLYALLAFSGTQMLATDSSVAFAQAEFWSIALREQRKAIATPDHNVEAVSLAAYFIVMTGFGMLRTRSLTPYTPPLDFFQLAQGALKVSPSPGEIEKSSVVLLTTYKILMPMWDTASEVTNEAYQPILSFRLDEEEQSYGDDMATNLNAYNETLKLISRFRNSIDSKDPYYQLPRWIPVFAQAVPKHFVQLLRQERPRALATLSCFWVLLLNTDPFVLQAFGDVEGCIPKRELDAILQVLSADWRDMLARCLDDKGAVQ